MRLITIAITSTVLAMTVLAIAVTSIAQEQPTVDVVSTPAAAPAPAPTGADSGGSTTQPAPSSLNGGSFSNDYLRVSIRNAAGNGNGAVAGTITRGRHDYPFQARRDSDSSISGTFKDEYGNTFP